MAAISGGHPYTSACIRGLLLALFSMLWWLSLALAGEPQHGLALGATVKYPSGVAHYAYADPQAV